MPKATRASQRVEDAGALPSAASTSRFGAKADAFGRRFRWLVVASLVVHLFFTPFVGWLGLLETLFEREVPEPPHELLDAIPIDLIDAPEEPASPAGLPDKDPVDVIEQLVPIATPAAAPPPKTPAAVKAPPAPSEAASKPAKPKPKLARGQDGGAAKPKKAAKAAKGSDAGAPKKGPKRPRRTIGSPVALAGKAGEIVKSNVRLQLIVYTDKLRGHPIGERIADLLPRLPQWSDFFAAAGVNPVRDFDRFFVAGPSFYHSDQLVIAMEYNTKRERIVAAVDALVKRDGEWLDNPKVLMARAVADRAERLFVLGKKPIVWVVPPQLQEQAAKLNGRIPRAEGPEALVATISDPKTSFARVNIDIPKSVHDLKIRITPLPEGEVKLELSALDANAEEAKRTAERISGEINALVAGLTTASKVARAFGFGALADSLKMPRVELHSRGDEIWAEQVLSKAQAEFIVDRIDKQIAALPRPAEAAPKPGKPAKGAPQSASSTNPAPPKTGSPKPRTPAKGP